AIGFGFGFGFSIIFSFGLVLGFSFTIGLGFGFSSCITVNLTVCSLLVACEVMIFVLFSEYKYALIKIIYKKVVIKKEEKYLFIFSNNS
ncbi:MAG: hypothetical protein HN369_03765, partial [Campylobacteraceae bacterium]|nr:hypothetical protein [Campylobacteraceae bacterium]